MAERYPDLLSELARRAVLLTLGRHPDLCSHGVCFTEFLSFKFLFKGYFGFSAASF